MKSILIKSHGSESVITFNSKSDCYKEFKRICRTCYDLILIDEEIDFEGWKDDQLMLSLSESIQTRYYGPGLYDMWSLEKYKHDFKAVGDNDSIEIIDYNEVSDLKNFKNLKLNLNSIIYN